MEILKNNVSIQLSAISYQLMVSIQPSAFSYQHSAISIQLSSSNYQLATISYQLLNKTGKHWFNLSKVTALVACATKHLKQREPLAHG
ncbi:MAG: hypothetical protein F6K56_34040 [Moorea sp. SIO3G5]|nr:hypothetical protein [Moorena sp. SIO3G5]